ncbi:hypothetical protein F5884DRAFT_685066 [Xylogone sp. PMI_703]|nr:hypothetical protein F5884DRAFT_685066 [Xylogone sp. PMI_703]
MSRTSTVTAATTTTANPTSRPTTPTSPVIIPARGHHDTTHEGHRLEGRWERQHGRKTTGRTTKRARDVHTPDSIPASVAALLATTAIPPPRSNPSLRRRPNNCPALTVDAVLQHTGESEKRLDLALRHSPLEFLLTPPEDLEDDEYFGSETGEESFSPSESAPSLDGDSFNESSTSLSSLLTPGSRGKKSLPTRRIRVITSPPGSLMLKDHPLSTPDVDIDELDFRVFQRPQDRVEIKPITVGPGPTPVQPAKSAFKSNLTASLRALRAAARSFSALTAPTIPPDDFLTRSIISIDPRVPFTDERMPPRLEDTPTPALRRYLNPTTNAPIDAHVRPYPTTSVGASPCTASIQMQTYKVSRSGKSASPSVISRRTVPVAEEVSPDAAAGPVARQRDMRENSDFIRIAVMEMAMRRKGKLDDQKPGRARWALPPRLPPTKPYEIGDDGIPVRWIAITLE